MSYVLSFRALTESVSGPLPGHFIVLGLGSLVTMGWGVSSCPVRALWYYLRRTEALRGPSVHLFCAIVTPSLPLKKAFVFKLLKGGIVKGRRMVARPRSPMMRFGAHDAWGVSTFLAAYWGVPTAHILVAACWRTPSVFVGGFLKGVAISYGVISSLGPLVAACQLLVST